MGIQYAPESEYMKEVNRWERPRRDGGMRPDSFEAFPRMLYRVVVRDNGQAVVSGEPQRYAHLTNAAEANARIAAEEAITSRCQLIVRDQREMDRAEGEGWRDSPQAALDHHAALQKAISDAAAERHFSDQRLSVKAQADAARADAAAGIEHVPDVPAPAKRPRGRPVKIQQAVP